MTRVPLLSLRRAAMITLSALVTAGLLVTGMTPAAQAAVGDASLVVRVTTHTGAPYVSGAVTAFPLGAGSRALNPAITATAVDGKPGSYLFETLDGGAPYAIGVQIRAASTSGAAAVQYFGGSLKPELARTFTPTAGANRLDFSLMAGSVSGKVLTNKGKGLAGVDVTLYKASPSQLAIAETVVSTATGAFSFPSLEPGSYAVRYETARAARAWVATNNGGTPALNSYTIGPRFTVAYGKPVVLSQKLTLGGTLTGVVRGSGVALPGARVQAYPLIGKPGAWTGSYTNAKFVATANAKGVFSLPGLPGGYYSLSIRPLASQAFGDPNPVPDLTTYNAYPYVKVVAGKTVVAPAAQTAAKPTVATVTGSFTGGPATKGGTVSFGNLADYANTERIETIQPNGTWSIDLPVGRYQARLRPTNLADPTARYLATWMTITVLPTGTPVTTLPMQDYTVLNFTTPFVISNASTTAVGTDHQVAFGVNHTAITGGFQWLRDGIPIFGATGTTYTSRGSDLGASLSARVTISDAEPTGTRLTGVTPAIVVTAAPAITNVTAPTIGPVAATHLSGEKLVVQPGVWSAYTINLAYQWTRDGTIIPGATSSVYTLTGADAGTTVGAHVTASRPGHVASPAVSAGAVTVAYRAAPVVKKAPTVVAVTKGLPAGQVRYTVSSGTWAPVPGYAFQWYADGQPISGATSARFLALPAENSGKALTVRVQAVIPGYSTGSTTLVARRGTAALVGTGTPVVTFGGSVVTAAQNVVVDSVLTASPGLWKGVDPEAATSFSYNWQRQLVSEAWVPIAGATKSTYTVTAADLSRPMRVVITALSPQYPSTVLSPAVAGVASPRQELQGGTTVTVGGVGVPLLPVTASGITWSVPAVTQAYQWFSCSLACTTFPSNYTAITGATAASYVPPAAAGEKWLVVRVTGSKVGFATAIVSSAPRQLGAAATISNTAPPTYGAGVTAGNATVLSGVSAVAGSWNIPGITRSYSWQKCLSACGTEANWTQVATGATYVPDVATYGTGTTRLRVVELASKTGYTTARQSAAVNLGLAPTFERATSVPKITRVTTSTSDILTVTPVTWTQPVAGKNVSYAWHVNDSWVDLSPGADNNTIRVFPMKPEYANKSITVRISYESGIPAYSGQGGNLEVLAFKLPAPPQITPTFTGSRVGDYLQFNQPYFTSPSGATFQTSEATYQWLSNGVPIAGQTGYTFQPSAAYLGKKISFRATLLSARVMPIVITSAQTTITKGVTTNGNLTVSGSGDVGSVVTAVPQQFNPGLTYTYSWYRNNGSGDVLIPKATGKTYTITAADQSTWIRPAITAKRAGFVDFFAKSLTSVFTSSRYLAPATVPAFTGTGAAGSLLSVTAPTFGGLKPVITYSWLRDGTAIGAYGATFSPTPEMVGQTISVWITAKLAGWGEWSWLNEGVVATPGPAPTAVGVNAPKVSGVAAGCSTLSATTGTWSADGARYSYQWHATQDGPIPGATGNQFTIPNGAYIGQKLFVVVTATRAGLAVGTAQSLPTAVVVATGC